MKTVSALLPVIKELRNNRRPPAGDYSIFYTHSTDGVELFCTLMGQNPNEVVIVAHPAVVGSYNSHVLALAAELSDLFSVVVFDFRGHGRSTGHCPLGFFKVSEDLEAVVDRVKGMGFEKIAVAGFSMGAGASMLLASRRDCFNALVSIGCPPRFPDMPLVEKYPRLVRSCLRLLGMRTDLKTDGGPQPVDVASNLPVFPKLLIFGECEVVPVEEIDEFSKIIPEPKNVHTVQGAWHADLRGDEKRVRLWLEKTLQ